MQLALGVLHTTAAKALDAVQAVHRKRGMPPEPTTSRGLAISRRYEARMALIEVLKSLPTKAEVTIPLSVLV